MLEIELEKTYLVRKIPIGLFDCQFKEIIDIYIPESYSHPTLRIRKKGDTYEITKKSPTKGNDSSEQNEHTILLTKEEFESLEKTKGKKVRKYRYYYNHNGIQAEFDVFKDDLEGLMLVDFEFKEVADKNSFKMPDFCLADVTQDKIFAGGMLCGKKYSDILPTLKKYGYIKLK
jgi:CYTH domain-containing protein